MRTIVSFIVLIALAGGGAAYYVKANNNDEVISFRTVKVRRGDIAPMISATGTLEPEELVDVGAQITGKILSFGDDPEHPGKTVDYCSNVTKGQLLANIDPTYYKAKVEQCEAALKKAEAELKQLTATCKQKKNEWERAQELMPQNAIAGTDYDAAEADYLVAQANIDVCKASVRSAEAALRMAQVDLGYTIIKSPINGVVIDRRVNVGQTVTSGLNTPSILLIATDLRRLQIWVLVNEAEIGHIFLGMPVSFTVATYPNETYQGKVIQIRYKALMTSNVVTYCVVIETENPDLKLFPYMTADVLFEEKARRNILMVPNAALQWEPSPSQIADDAPRKTASLSPDESNGESPEAASERMGRVWVADGDKVRPIDVVVGITDDINTEISGPGLEEGMEVVIGETKGTKLAVDKDEEANSDETTNPFLPKPPKGFRRRRGPPPG